MLEAPVDGLGRPVGSAGPVEVGQDVGGPLLQGSAELAHLDKQGRDAACEGADELMHEELAELPVRFPVGSDHALVDVPGRFDFSVLFVGESCRAGRLSARGRHIRQLGVPAGRGWIFICPTTNGEGGGSQADVM